MTSGCGLASRGSRLVGGSGRLVRGRGGGGGAAALAHVVADVVELAVRVVDVILALVEGAVHAHGGVDEGAGALLVCGELQTNECQRQPVCSRPRRPRYLHPRITCRRGPWTGRIGP